MNSHSHEFELEKSAVRRVVLEQLRNQPEEERRQKSNIIMNRLVQMAEFKKSRVIMFYVSLLEEVDTLSLLKTVLQEGRSVIVPFVDTKNKTLLSVPIKNPETDLTPGSYGILEPKKNLVNHFDVNQLDLVLVPGIAFDRKGRRLGRGKGYYDRFLKSLSRRTQTIGLAFNFQMLETIPTDERDIAVNQVITNE